MAQLVAKTYAGALFEVAVEMKKIDGFGKELSFISDTFEQYPAFYELYKTPKISVDEKHKITGEVFKDGLSLEIMNFLKVLLDKRRANNFKEIAKEYQRLANEYNNIMEAVAITAIPLKDQDKLNLEEKLSSITGKKVKLENQIDPSIIGGILVKMGDKVIDGTIQSRLSELQENFAQIIV